MSIVGLLFHPNGRIQANQFWRGIILLVGFQIVLSVLQLLNVDMGLITNILGVLIIYPYICVYSKRLHDSNKSAWMFLLFAVGYVVITAVSFFFIPGIGEFFTQYMALASEGDAEAAEALAQKFSEEARSGGAIVSIAGLLVSNLFLGWLCARLYSDPNTNKYGPPVGSQAGGSNDVDDIFS